MDIRSSFIYLLMWEVERDGPELEVMDIVQVLHVGGWNPEMCVSTKLKPVITPSALMWRPKHLGQEPYFILSYS